MLTRARFPGILAVVHTAPRILYMRAFAALFAGKPRGLHVRNVIASSAAWQAATAAAGATLAADYAAAAQYVQCFQAVRMIHEHGRSGAGGAPLPLLATADVAAAVAAVEGVADAEAVAVGDAKAVRAQLRTYRGWKAELDKMKVSQAVGCLLVDSKVLKNALAPVVAQAQANARATLAAIARAACRSALDDLTARNAALAIPAAGLDAYMAYRTAHATQAAARAAALAAADTVHDMYETLLMHGGRLDRRDEIRRDDLTAAAAAYAGHIADGRAWLAAQFEATSNELRAAAAAAREAAAAAAEEVAAPEYADIGDDTELDVVCEALAERAAAAAALRASMAQLATHAASLGLPPVRSKTVKAAKAGCLPACVHAGPLLHCVQ